MIKNCKMKVTTSQFREIQKILFKKQIYWDCETNSKTKTSDYLYIKKNTISWETLELKNNNYVEINANDFIRDNTTFPIHKIEKDGLYVVEFTDVNTARVVWVKSVLENNKTLKVGTTSDGWVNFYIDCWKDISKEDVMDLLELVESIEDVAEEKEIKPGTIVQATRKSTSDKFKDYIWQGVYFGYCNGKHLIDANTTHVQLADEILLIPTLTKKEAKQKISELFSDSKNVSSQKIRDIIDLIEG